MQLNPLTFLFEIVNFLVLLLSSPRLARTRRPSARAQRGSSSPSGKRPRLGCAR
ncbi:MAG: hypothetical protein IPM79_27875 [Polyangiaceae bacterium]|nr:hypothetical protein [Polyangiaceae bacterium]